MFYSHTFLARKGPLGTVWCAAHLQHRLRKSQYISTNIPSTVERIIDPQVPIALRMSAHLLLGVVRVYAKQVDYFHEDCNGVVITLNRISSALTVNLPDDANHAPVHSITLPQKFSLDALELDDYFLDGFEDTHRKSHEEITLTEQIPTGEDPFITITFDERAFRSSSFTEDISGTGAVPMEEDVIPPVQEDTDVPLRDLSEHNDDDDANERTVGVSSPITSPIFETMRDAEHGSHFNGSLILPDQVEPDTFLDELMSNHDKDTRTIVNDEVELPDLQFSSPRKHQEQNSSGNINFSIFSEHRSPQLEIQESPAIAEPKVRKRKRKQFFDRTTVLSNEHMKTALADTHDLRRKRRNCPSSSLDVWKLSKWLKKDSIFDEPYLTGSCVELQHIYKEDCVSSKPHLVASTSENAQATSSAQRNTPRRDGGDDADTEVLHHTPRPDGDDDGDTEVLRNTEQASPGGHMPSEFTNPFPLGGSNFTPENFSSRVQSERFDTTGGAEMLHSTTVGESTRNFDSEMETPSTFQFEHTSLFDIPEQSTSAGDLDFLEQDDHSVAGFQGSAEFGSGSVSQSTPGLTLSSRTRAVAQYLKRQSPITPIPEGAEETAGNLNLIKVLEGKSRKICARMFYETLVLKSYDLVDLQQEKPYADINIKVTPKLSKGDFLG